MSTNQYRPGSWQILPPVVKNLLIINGILFLATVVFEDKFGFELTRYLGLYYPASEYFRPHQFVSHLFMHGSFLHLFSNMLALWMFGNALENLWGGKRFLTYYLITGLGAALIHTAFSWYDIGQMKTVIDAYASNPSPPDLNMLLSKYRGLLDRDIYDRVVNFLPVWSENPLDPALVSEGRSIGEQLYINKLNIPTVGASGAVFGVLLAFGMLFPNTLIYVYFAIPVKAKWFVFFYGLFELYSGIQNNPSDNVAHFAHLGGMLFGYLLIRSWRNKYRGS